MDLVDRVSRLCAAPGSDRVLRERLILEIGHRVRFDGHVFAMTDPVSGVVSSPHATVPMVPADHLPRLVGKRYACRDHAEWSAWLAREFGVLDVAFVALGDRYGDWGFLELWRTHTQFGDVERGTLNLIAPVLASGLRAVVAASFAASHDGDEASIGTETSAVETGVILLDTDLRVRSETSTAAVALLRLLPPDKAIPPVPAVAFNVGAALLAGGMEPWTRVHLGDGRWMTARADRLDERIAVSISPCTAAERVDLFARSHGLSPRETEVLALVLRGLDSRTIAACLTIAPTTAEDHLRSLLAKTRTRSRQLLIVRALAGTP